MDIKIGLLIKNQIDLEEVVKHNRLLLSQKKSFGVTPSGSITEGAWPGKSLMLTSI